MAKWVSSSFIQNAEICVIYFLPFKIVQFQHNDVTEIVTFKLFDAKLLFVEMKLFQTPKLNPGEKNVHNGGIPPWLQPSEPVQSSKRIRDEQVNGSHPSKRSRLIGDSCECRDVAIDRVVRRFSFRNGKKPSKLTVFVCWSHPELQRWHDYRSLRWWMLMTVRWFAWVLKGWWPCSMWCIDFVDASWCVSRCVDVCCV